AWLPGRDLRVHGPPADSKLIATGSQSSMREAPSREPRRGFPGPANGSALQARAPPLEPPEDIAPVPPANAAPVPPGMAPAAAAPPVPVLVVERGSAGSLQAASTTPLASPCIAKSQRRRPEHASTRNPAISEPAGASHESRPKAPPQRVSALPQRGRLSACKRAIVASTIVRTARGIGAKSSQPFLTPF